MSRFRLVKIHFGDTSFETVSKAADAVGIDIIDEEDTGQNPIQAETYLCGGTSEQDMHNLLKEEIVKTDPKAKISTAWGGEELVINE